ncbi:hypothetical protein E24_00112 [Faustovirus]|nr:hypothetical protein PRJ_Fausto_00100 [Faustovirus]AMN83044.1 hypothetical protein E24_00112 [Faustovirus]AMN84028.1 hypothetical protein D5a_00112 [Faustovirus]AMN85014.1 hypothetical protein E23_00112 [Faustovirus]QBR99014.1 hypothetical protein [Faustovirus mariensis]
MALNTDTIGCVLIYNPVAFMGVSKRWDKQAYKAISDYNGNSYPNPTPLEIETFALSTSFDKFTLITKYIHNHAVARKMGMLLLKNEIFDKLELLATIKLNNNTKSLLEASSSMLRKYVSVYGFDYMHTFVSGSLPSCYYQLEKWNTSIHPRYLLPILTKKEIIKLYANYKHLSDVFGLTYIESLKKLTLSKLKLVIELSKRCKMGILLKLMTKSCIDIISIIVNTQHNIELDYDHIGFSSDITIHSYMYTYVADIPPMHAFIIRQKIPRLAGVYEAEFNIAINSIDYFMDAVVNNNELIMERFNAMVDIIAPYLLKKSYKSLFAFIHKYNLKPLAEKLTLRGFMRIIPKTKWCKNIQLYEQMIITAISTDDIYNHHIITCIILNHIIDNGLSDELRDSLQAYADMTKNCFCRIRLLLDDIIAVGKDNDNKQEKYIKIASDHGVYIYNK